MIRPAQRILPKRSQSTLSPGRPRRNPPFEVPAMNRSSTAISLVLIGSALALAGCGKSEPDWDDEEPTQPQNATTTGGHGGYVGGARVFPRVGVGGGGRAG